MENSLFPVDNPLFPIKYRHKPLIYHDGNMLEDRKTKGRKFRVLTFTSRRTMFLGVLWHRGGVSDVLMVGWYAKVSIDAS